MGELGHEYIKLNPDGVREENLFLTEVGLFKLLGYGSAPIVKVFEIEVREILNKLKNIPGYERISDEKILVKASF